MGSHRNEIHPEKFYLPDADQHVVESVLKEAISG